MEDIVDSGLTLTAIVEMLKSSGHAASVKVPRGGGGGALGAGGSGLHGVQYTRTNGRQILREASTMSSSLFCSVSFRFEFLLIGLRPIR